jgi:PKD repeat protein
VSVVVHGGSAVQVVASAIAVRTAADSTAPGAPAGLTAEPVAGGLELSWEPVAAGDLAGYKVLYSPAAIYDEHSTGVRELPGLSPDPWCLLTGISAETHVRVVAVDTSGNRSAPSAEVVATPLSGAAPVVGLSVDVPTGVPGTAVVATAVGAASYDWDTDGDGEFDDITGDALGSAVLDTSRAGVLRPRVRATGAAAEEVGTAAASVLIESNSRPVASAVATPQSGYSPLEVTFTGEAWDLEDAPEDLIIAWDTNGDGTYNAGAGWDTLTPPIGTYVTPGIYNAKLRVEDSDGAWDVDTVTIQCLAPGSPDAELVATPNSFYIPNLDSVTVELDAGASTSPTGSALSYEFDPFGTGEWVDSGANALYSFEVAEGDAGLLNCRVRVTNAEGHSNIAEAIVRAYRFGTTTVDRNSSRGIIRLRAYDGRPVLAYLRDTTSTGDFDGLVITVAHDKLGRFWNTPHYRINFDPAGLPEMPVGMVITEHPTTQTPTINVCAYDDQNDDFYVSNWNRRNGSSGLVQLYNTADEGYAADMEVVDGNPAFIMADGPSDDLIFRRGVTYTASGAFDPERVVTGSAAIHHFDLAVIDGRPAVAFYDSSANDLMYSIADDIHGVNWPAAITIDSSPDNVGFNCRLIDAGGVPVVVYTNNTTKDIQLVRSSTADGAVPADWGSPVEVPTADDVEANYQLSLAIIDGKLCIASASSEVSADLRGLFIVFSEDLTGSSWEDPIWVNRNSVFGDDLSLMNLDGHPAMAYQEYGSVEFTTPWLE